MSRHKSVTLAAAVAAMAALCCADVSHAQSRDTTHRSRVSATGGASPTGAPSLMGVNYELQLSDRLVLATGPSVHVQHTQVGLSHSVALDTYLAGVPFNGLFVRMEAAAVLTIESDTSERDIGFLGSILVGSTLTAPTGLSTGITIGGQTYVIPGRVQRVQLDVSIRLSIGYTF